MLAAFYHRFIPHFSSIMAPVTDYMKGSWFNWTKEVEDAFQLIKMHLTTAPILVLHDFLNNLNYIVMLRKWLLEQF